MPQIPRHTINAIREAIDIVEVVREHVALRRAGGNYVGLCPFHQEKTPSFNVVPAKHLYHCFGCGAGGDVFKFLMQLEGLSFTEAVRDLGARAGVQVEERDLTPAEQRALKHRATLYDVLEAAAQFYESNLWTRDAAHEARAYLERRSVTRETARHWRLGFIREAWTDLLDHLQAQGFDIALIRDAGLARHNQQRGSHYDTLRNRLVIPIRDDRGRVIAFGGRLLEGDGPKYLNTPETSLYQKSKILYGGYTARAEIQRRKSALVVEGYFDVISLHQAGFAHAVATCGTALTRDHAERLRRMAERVIVLTDADEAGSRAAERSLPLFLEKGLIPFRLQIPDAKDPDDLIREQGSEAMAEALERHCEPLVEWVVQRMLTTVGTDAASRERVTRELLPILSMLPGPLVSRVAAHLQVPESILAERVANYRPRERYSNYSDEAPPPEPERRPWRPTDKITHLLWLLVHRYDRVADLVERCLDPDVFAFDNAIVQPLVARLVVGEQAAAIVNDLEHPMLHRTLSAVVARGELYTEEQATVGICQIIERLFQPIRTARIARLTQEVERALANDDSERYRTVATARSTAKSLEKGRARALLSREVPRWIELTEQEAELWKSAFS